MTRILTKKRTGWLVMLLAGLFMVFAPKVGAQQTNQTQTQTRVMGVFRPLNQGDRAEVVKALKAVADQYGTNREPIIMSVVAGNNRRTLALEMITMLKEAGIDARLGDVALVTPTNAPPDFFFKCNDGERMFAADLADAFIKLAPQRIRIEPAPDWAAGRVEVYVYGDPVFSSKGDVMFR